MLGLYHPTKGTISVNGKHLTDYNPEALKQSV
ncbi:hypothetical protein KBA84_05320 [Patescibacteria group bacterium]|nr:hypothetical protein [Patescibacteria group bacterium]